MIRGNLKISILEGRNLKNKDSNLLSLFTKNTSDPWAEIQISNQPLIITNTQKNTLNPRWNCEADVPLCHWEDHLQLKVHEADVLRTQSLGEARITLNPLQEPWKKELWVPLGNGNGEIFVSLSFVPFRGPDGPELNLEPEPLGKEYYFPPRIGGSFQLYQDAHTDTFIDEKKLTGYMFTDVAQALEKAKKFIYIAGWSVYTSLRLERNEHNTETLGQLLIRRANEGVRVLIMIWNEKFSAGLCKELIGTHDTKTVNYFKNTSVTVASVRRSPFNASELKENIIETLYTHHMKMIVADDPDEKLISFVGGVDLTDGRWDGPDHPLWCTLSGVHKGDFYNGFAPTLTPKTGPREPWHDLHSKVVGPLAYDCLTTFEERWKRQVPKQAHFLYPIRKEDHEFEDPTSTRVWNLQLLRSIDSDSSELNPLSKALNNHKTLRKDCSVQDGFVNLVRSTTRFMYIESQYFLGSSYAWKEETSSCASNVVPAEIVEQIASGILNKKPIRVYIVIPLCPEGDPNARIGSCYMNDILRWQFLTFQMMYSRIAQALKIAKSEDHPEDYLLVLCLGQKISSTRAARSIPMPTPKKGSEAYLWQQRKRFLVYVHSKMALADDARIIVGSANLNQRSLDGSRDTEVAIAASQVDYEDPSARSNSSIVVDGDVSTFRRNLWKEHTKGLSETIPQLGDPGSKDCIAYIREKSLQLLKEYANDKLEKELDFRFLKFPYQVSRDGDVTALPGFETIPDMPGIFTAGKRSFIPTIFTT